MKVLVCGDRNWIDRAAMTKVLQDLIRSHKIDLLVHGDCKGADKMAGEIAKYLGIKVRSYPALWSVHGVYAAPIRNKEMLEEERPDLVLAFHDHIEGSKSTRHLVTLAAKMGIEVKPYYSEININNLTQGGDL